jgi:hypothetical protein
MKKGNVLRYILIFTSLLFFTATLAEGYFIYKLNNDKKELSSRVEQKDKELESVEKALARLEHMESIVDEGTDEDDVEVLEFEEPNAGEREPNPTTHNFTYLVSANDTPREVFNSMKEEIDSLDFPIIYPKGSTLATDVQYSYLDFYSESNPDDYDFLVLETTFAKNGKEVSVMEGFYGWGNTCGESYRISTNLGELHACVHEESTSITYFDESIVNPQGTAYQTIFTVNNEYSKEEVRSLMAELEIVK